MIYSNVLMKCIPLRKATVYNGVPISISNRMNKGGAGGAICEGVLKLRMR